MPITNQFTTRQPREYSSAPSLRQIASENRVDQQYQQRRRQLQLQWEEARLQRYIAITEISQRQGGRIPELSMETGTVANQFDTGR